MKKLMLLSILLFSLLSYSQQRMPSNFINPTGKSLVMVDIDTIHSHEIINIKDRLTAFSSANGNSQFLLLTGAVITVAGIFLYKPEKVTDINPFPIIGGGFGLIGAILYIDSFRFLNMNKKFKKAKPKFEY